jgi:hypothetical protein
VTALKTVLPREDNAATPAPMAGQCISPSSVCFPHFDLLPVTALALLSSTNTPPVLMAPGKTMPRYQPQPPVNLRQLLLLPREDNAAISAQITGHRSLFRFPYLRLLLVIAYTLAQMLSTGFQGPPEKTTPRYPQPHLLLNLSASSASPGRQRSDTSSSCRSISASSASTPLHRDPYLKYHRPPIIASSPNK